MFASGSRSSRSAHIALERALSQLDNLIELAGDQNRLNLRDPALSGWSVAEQIEHLRRSDLTILKALEELDEDGPRQGSPSIAGRLVLITGFIPRGKGRAPGATSPGDTDLPALPGGLETVRQGFLSLKPGLERLAACRATIRHPALGHFTALQMLSFAGIHHHHHQKIIRDICTSARTRST